MKIPKQALNQGAFYNMQSHLTFYYKKIFIFTFNIYLIYVVIYSLFMFDEDKIVQT